MANPVQLQSRSGFHAITAFVGLDLIVVRFDGVDEEGEFDAPPPLGLLAFRFCARERDGFSTFLTQSKADTIGKNPSVLAVFEDHRRELHTTRSPQFLGLRNQRGLWSDSDYDSNVIIGLLDTCIWPERRSFLDRNLGGRELVDLGEGHNRCPQLLLLYCGYPGFDLYCNDKNDTVLVLPTSVKAFVKHIDYKSQLINVTDSDNCFPRKIQGINLSSPPFQFYDRKIDSYLSDYGLFNCTPETDTDSSDLIPCLSSSRHPVYAFSSLAYVERVPILSCTKMYSVSSVPSDIWNSPFLELTWSEPKCGQCEVKGEKCRFKNNSTDFNIECFNPEKNKVVYAFCHVYHYDKTEKENQAMIEKFLEDYKALKPTRYLYADVKRITNQLTEKLGQGAYGTVFKGKLSSEIYVVMKILNIFKGDGEEFINGVRTMGTIHHVNVVCLVGFCVDGFRRALVYEFLPNDSLDKFISSVDSNSFLGWEKLLA
nr:rust resistance kinase lr10 [Quercus suber]